MLEPQVAPYGSWKSPITTDLIVSESISPGQVVLDGQDIYWSETRPSEGGRSPRGGAASLRVEQLTEW